jgi:putative cardiolipin synthase
MSTGNATTWLAFTCVTLLSACASTHISPKDCPAGTQSLENCPPIGAIDDPEIAELYEMRAWTHSSNLDFDPVQAGVDAEIPINRARAKFIGSTDDDGLMSLATKIWLVERAEHTIDVVYYIFADDLVGHALLGALCEAVERGVDVRIMVDSLGSIGFKKDNLRALQSCAIDAGFIRNADGSETIYKARVQSVIFNAMSEIFVNHNRRSHDKLLVVDGRFSEKTAVMTGGRNMSLSYYGILPDGSPNPDTYRDAEIFLRGGEASAHEEYSVGYVSETYYSLLFLFKNNKRLSMTKMSNPRKAYASARDKFGDALARLKSLPRFEDFYDQMPRYVTEGFTEADVMLAHELANLTDTKVVANAVENAEFNPNSIVNVFEKVGDERYDRVQIVSPYIFAALYKDASGNVILDEAAELLDWLDENPESEVIVLTNSVLTSDNFSTQSVIDMDLAPRLLLSSEMQKKWLQKLSKSELNPELVESELWVTMVNHPRLKVFETGQLDDAELGGEVEYGKLHAKYVVGDDFGFIGTSNFDYRSRLYNNEMGFFFRSEELASEIQRNTAYLLSISYQWGSPDWLEMRKRLMELKGRKASSTRNQRKIYKTIKGTGTHWYF